MIVFPCVRRRQWLLLIGMVGSWGLIVMLPGAANASPCSHLERHLTLAPPPAHVDVTALGYPGCYTLVMATIPGCERCDKIWAGLSVRIRRFASLGAVMLVKAEWSKSESPIAEVARRGKTVKAGSDLRFPVAILLDPHKVVVAALRDDEIEPRLDQLEQTHVASNSTAAAHKSGFTALDVVTASVFGVAITATVLTVSFGIKALIAHDAAFRNRSMHSADVANRSALMADIFLPIAIGAGATGGALFAIRARKATAEGVRTKAFLAPYGGPTGGGIVARWVF